MIEKEGTKYWGIDLVQEDVLDSSDFSNIKDLFKMIDDKNFKPGEPASLKLTKTAWRKVDRLLTPTMRSTYNKEDKQWQLTK